MRNVALAVALALFTVPASAAIIVVTSSQDGDGPGCTLREGIASANTDTSVGGCTAGSGADEIVTGQTTVTLTQGALVVAGPLTITGPFRLVQTRRAGILEVTGTGDLLITDVTFEGGRADGGALRIASSADVTVQGGAFLGNDAPTEGGAIWVSALGQFTALGTTFAGNLARGAFSGGGAIYTDGGTVQVDGVFRDNRAIGTAGSGGAIHNPNGATVLASGSFFRNRAKRGGALASAGGPTVVTGTFSDNEARDGGALFGSGGVSLVVADAVFFLNGGSPTDGGAIWIDAASTLRATTSTFLRNQGDSGGAVFVDGGTFIASGNLFQDNRAYSGPSAGGAVFIDGGTATFDGDAFENNRSDDVGGAIAADGGATLSLVDVTLRNNRTTDPASDGGGIHLAAGSGVTLGLLRTDLLGNSAQGGGGGLWLGSGTTLTATETLFEGNRSSTNDPAAAGGGGLLGVGATVELTSSTFRSNTTRDGDGGGAALVGGVITLHDVTFLDNATNGPTSNGGGLFIAGADAATLTSLTVSANRTRGAGGGLYLAGTPVEIELSDVVANEASDSGGGIAIEDDASVRITTTSVTGNRAGLQNSNGGAGGGIAALDGAGGLGIELRITQSLLADNETVGPFPGGGLYVGSEWDAFLWNSTVYGNASGQRGGGIALANDGTPFLSVDSATIVENVAPRGGGVFAGSGSGRFNIRNSILADNHAAVSDDQFRGRVQTQGFNIVGPNNQTIQPGIGDQLDTDPLLGLLEDNGGPTLTVTVPSFSPARDAGNTVRTVDQRGYLRTDGPDDVGALDTSAEAPFADLLAATPAALETAETMTEAVRLGVAPNPLGARATATFAVREAQPVTVSLYDVMGRRVRTLFEGEALPGAKVAVAVDGAGLAAGVYVIVLQGTTVRATHQLTVVR